MTTDAKRLLRVFLCHAAGDKPPVRKLYDRLTADGIDAWLDQENLLPGQNWRIEIPKAVRNSDIVIVCLSKISVDKEGFVQKEIKFALDVADLKPEGAIFIIPARLEECKVPDRLSQYHWVDMFEDKGYDRLMKALKHCARTVGATIERPVKPVKTGAPASPVKALAASNPRPKKVADPADRKLQAVRRIENKYGRSGVVLGEEKSQGNLRYSVITREELKNIDLPNSQSDSP